MDAPATPLRRHLSSTEASPSPYRRRAAAQTPSDADTGSPSSTSSSKQHHDSPSGKEGHHDKASTPRWELELGDLLGAFMQLGLLTLFIWEIAAIALLLAGFNSSAFKGFLAQRAAESGEEWDAREVRYLYWHLLVLILAGLWQLWTHGKRLLRTLMPSKTAVVPQLESNGQASSVVLSHSTPQIADESYTLDTLLSMHMVINEWPKIAVLLCLINRLQGMQAWCSIDWENFSRHFFSQVFHRDALNALALAAHSHNSIIADHPPAAFPADTIFSSCLSTHVLNIIRGSLFLSCINCIGTLLRLFTKESSSVKDFLAAVVTGMCGTALILYRPLTASVVVGEVQAIFTSMSLLASPRYSRLAVASLFFALLTTAFLLLAAHCRQLHIQARDRLRAPCGLPVGKIHPSNGLDSPWDVQASDQSQQVAGSEAGTLTRRAAWDSPPDLPELNLSPDVNQIKPQGSIQHPRSGNSLVPGSLVRKGLKFDEEDVDGGSSSQPHTGSSTAQHSGLAPPLDQSARLAGTTPIRSPAKRSAFESPARSWLATAREMGATVFAAVTGADVSSSSSSTPTKQTIRRSGLSQSMSRKSSISDTAGDVGHTTMTIHATDGISQTLKSRLSDVRTHSVAHMQPAGLPASIPEAGPSSGVPVAHKHQAAAINKDRYMQAMGSFVHHKNALIDNLESQDDYLELGRPNDGPMPDYSTELVREMYEDSVADDEYDVKPGVRLRTAMSKVGFIILLLFSAIAHILSAVLVGLLQEELDYRSGWLANDVAASAVQMVLILVLTLCVLSVKCGGGQAGSSSV